MRCPAQLAPAYAQTLGDMVPRASGWDEVLLELEAHALFAGASQQEVLSMGNEFGHFGQHWAAAVVNFGQRMAELDAWPAALDAARWLTAIIGQLTPYTMIDAQAATVALDLARWQESIFSAVGDSAAAADVAQVIAALEARGGNSGGTM